MSDFSRTAPRAWVHSDEAPETSFNARGDACEDEARGRWAVRPQTVGGRRNGVSVKAVVRDLGKTKSGKQKAAKEARKIVEMKGKQIKDELSSARIRLFTKFDEDSVEASTIDDVIHGSN